MTNPIQPGALLENLRNTFVGISATVSQANNLTGGGGYENWAVVQYLTMNIGANYTYRREAPVDGKRVDIGFNIGGVTMQTPLIWTEWKANPNTALLGTGLTADIGKLAALVRDNHGGPVLPMPLVIGIGPPGASFPYPVAIRLSNNAGSMCLYLSSFDTWKAAGVYDETWYSQMGASEREDSLLSAAARFDPADGQRV